MLRLPGLFAPKAAPPARRRSIAGTTVKIAATAAQRELEARVEDQIGVPCKQSGRRQQEPITVLGAFADRDQLVDHGVDWLCRIDLVCAGGA